MKNSRGILFLLFTFLTVSVFAQSSSTVQGILKNEQGEAVPFATLALYKLPDSTLIKSVSADENGAYIITVKDTGTFYLAASALEYTKTFSEPFSLSASSEYTFNLVVAEKMKEVSETVIISKRTPPTVTQEAGSTIVNIENSSLNAGVSVAEALKRVPGVTVDKDGIAKLKGKDGIMIMIDGKPLYMDAEQIGTLLKSIPADQVKEIEVMSSPSANYDAAGNGGMINIKLKKGAYEGFNGTVTTSAGQGVYPKANAGIQLSYKKKKLSLNLGYQYNYKKTLQNYFIHRYYISEGDSAYLTDSDFSTPEHVHTILTSGSYNITNKGSLHWDFTALSKAGAWQGGSESHLFNKNGSLHSGFVSTEDSRESTENFGGSLGYTHKYDTVGTELSGLMDYKINNTYSRQIFVTRFLNASGEETASPFSYQSFIPINFTQGSGKIDFIKPLNSTTKIESGIKYTSIGTNSKITNTIEPENHFAYTEQISAAYAMMHHKAGKFSLKGGVRVEHTSNKGIQKSIDSTFNRNYTNVFPSASFTYQHSDITSYTLNYSRRIDRPRYESLNPFSYYSDPYSRYSGNPFLLPQYTHSAEFSLSNWQGVFLTTLSYSYTRQNFAEVWLLDPASSITTYTSTNLKNQQNTGVSFSLNMPLTNWWTTSDYVYLYNNRITGDVGFGEQNLNRFAASFNSTQTFKLTKKTSAELSGNYESPNYWGTVLYREVWQISAGIQQKILKQKATLKISVSDIFWKYVYVGKGTFGNIRTEDQYKWDNRVVMVSFSYKFGKRFSLSKEDLEMKQENSGRNR